jgi:hypothetical protein
MPTPHKSMAMPNAEESVLVLCSSALSLAVAIIVVAIFVVAIFVARV